MWERAHLITNCCILRCYVLITKDHPYNRNRKHLDGTIKKCAPPKYRDGTTLLREVSKLNVVLRKGDRALAALEGSIWKKSVFWELLWPCLILKKI